MTQSALLLLMALSAPYSGAPRSPSNTGNFDALANAPKQPQSSLAKSIHDDSLVKPGTTVQLDDRMGVPTFVWATPGPGSSPLTPGETPESAARRYLSRYASMYRLSQADVDAALVSSVHHPKAGPIIVKFRQTVGGVDVFRDEIKVLMTNTLDLISISGYLTGVPGAPASFQLDVASVLARAVASTGLSKPESTEFKPTGESRGGYTYFTWTSKSDIALSQPARTKPVFFHFPDHLEPAYYVELQLTDGKSSLLHQGLVISAASGQVLFRKSLVDNDTYSFRVWADTASPNLFFDGPQGTTPSPMPSAQFNASYDPAFILPNLVSLQNGPISTNDPWLAPNATETVGNNVDAYVDLFAPDGYSPTTGDFRATATAPGVFDRTYDTTLSAESSQQQQMASITQLFYDTNELHDIYYDLGFDEVSGNAQASNYGRGGVEGDVLLAEAQDFSGRNNSNMQTPPDGQSPRMQMYVWDGISQTSLVVQPGNLNIVAVPAQFGPQTYNVTATVVASNPPDACTAITNTAAVAGNIVLIDRGTCAFVNKAAAAEAAGAVGMIVDNNQAGAPFQMGGTTNVTIPSVMISQADGTSIKALGTATATLTQQATVDRDGTIDNQIVAHEWGHYLSNRLIGDASGINTNMSMGLGEGWADTDAMLMTVRAEDANVPTNANWAGVYAVATYVASGQDPVNGYYWGIRRVPYSTNMNIDPLTFIDIEQGVPLNGSVAPISFGADGSVNTEVHSLGEVWATMMWECYASLLNDSSRHTFDEARDLMRGYLVASLKLTPNSPTLLEARDAVIAAMYANDPADAALCQAAFAKRGAGLRAVGPNRFDDTNSGVVEDYHSGNDLSFVSASITDDVHSCDNDGFLDDGETGNLVVTLKNTGIGPLSATTAQITVDNPDVTLANGGLITFPSSVPYGTTQASVQASMNGAAGITSFNFTIAFQDPAMSIPGAVTATYGARGNVDDVPASSATDDVESEHTLWTAVSAATEASGVALDTGVAWQRIEASPTDHRWFGVDDTQPSDLYLISPPLHVSATGTFGFTFSSRYALEFDPTDGGTAYDGAVLELTTDNGQTWNDIGANATPGYNGTVFTGSDNPLSGRQAFTNQNPSYPNFDTVTVSLGNTYAGQTVNVRFRVASDDAAASYGWEVDNIAFQGLTDTPFNSLVPNQTPPCTTSISSSASSASSSGTGSGTGSSGSTATTGSPSSSGSAGSNSGSTTGSVTATATSGNSGSTGVSGTDSASNSSGGTNSTSTSTSTSTSGSGSSSGSTHGSSSSSGSGSTGSSASSTTGSHSSTGTHGSTSTGTGSTGTTGNASTKKGCGCSSDGQAGSEALLALLGMATLLARRRVRDQLS